MRAYHLLPLSGCSFEIFMKSFLFLIPAINSGSNLTIMEVDLIVLALFTLLVT